MRLVPTPDRAERKMWMALVEFVQKAQLGWAAVGISAAPIYDLDLGEAANDPHWANPTDAV